MEPINRTYITLYAKGLSGDDEQIAQVVPLLSVCALDSTTERDFPALAECMKMLCPALDDYNERAYGLNLAWYQNSAVLPIALDQVTSEVANLTQFVDDLTDAFTDGNMSLDVKVFLGDVSSVCTYAGSDLLLVKESMRPGQDGEGSATGPAGGEVDVLGDIPWSDETESTAEDVTQDAQSITLTIFVADSIPMSTVYKDMPSLVERMHSIGVGEVTTRPGTGLDADICGLVGAGVQPAPIQAAGFCFSWLWSYDPTNGFHVEATLAGDGLTKSNRRVLDGVRNGGDRCGYFQVVDRVVFFNQIEDLDPELRLLGLAIRALDTGASILEAMDAFDNVGTVFREYHTGPCRDIFHVTPTSDGSLPFPQVKIGIKKVYPRYRVREDKGGRYLDVEPAYVEHHSDVEPSGAAPEVTWQPEDFLLAEERSFDLILPEGLTLWPGSMDAAGRRMGNSFGDAFRDYNEMVSKNRDLFDPKAPARTNIAGKVLSGEAMARQRSDARSLLATQAGLVKGCVPVDWAHQSVFKAAIAQLVSRISDDGKPIRPLESEKTQIIAMYNDGDSKKFFATFEDLRAAFAPINVADLIDALEQVKVKPKALVNVQVGTATGDATYSGDTECIEVKVGTSYPESINVDILDTLSGKNGSCYYAAYMGRVLLSADSDFTEYDDTVIKLLKITGWVTGEIKRVPRRRPRRDHFVVTQHRSAVQRSEFTGVATYIKSQDRYRDREIKQG
ncbi:hypothetical protein [Amycolatopsis sp. H20-H5]|uniref:hypothetical protein n=1 Tax=Amycolatopsis sp. H20-H5 TaxID=3046309 RepID=UPI002DBF4C61|nr:hypothetical protein [Amycolatopsis sp. H20-H5]MEC3973777.1 hypothetical protein [Amycolatopsis sp. H20-H5]